VLDPTTMAYAAGVVFGAYAKGILWAFNNLIAPAVIAIATFIADFLMGASPPPKGPLHDITQGGAATMLAWLEGFIGVSLTPVQEMATRVNKWLGAIGGMSHEQVEAALAKLDQALEPFIANLDIARAKMERLTEPLKVFQDMLERKLQKSLDKFFKGQIGEEAVRAIDKQMEGLNETLTKAEDMTYQAELQLALAKSQQAVQRALLEIQLRRTKAAEKEKKPKKPTGKEETPEEAAEDLGLPTMSGDAIGDFLGVSDAEIKALFGELGDSFQAGMDVFGVTQDLETAKGKVGELGKQLDRMKKADPFKGFREQINAVFGEGGEARKAFEEFSLAVSGALESLGLDKFARDVGGINVGPMNILSAAIIAMTAGGVISGIKVIAGFIWSMTFGQLFGTAGALVNMFKWLISATAVPVVSGIKAISTAIINMTAANVVAGANGLKGAMAWVLGAGAPLVLVGLVLLGIANRFEKVKEHVGGLTEALKKGELGTALGEIVNILADVPMGIADLFVDVDQLEIYKGVFANLKIILAEVADSAYKSLLDTHNFNSLASRISRVPSSIGDWLSGVYDKVKEFLVDKMENALKLVTDLIFGHCLQSDIEGIVEGIPTWLAGLATALLESLVNRFSEAIQEVYQYLLDTNNFNSLASRVMRIVTSIVGWLTGLGTELYNNLVLPFIEKAAEIADKLFNTENPDSLASQLMSIPGKIQGWFSGLREKLERWFLDPFEGVVTTVLDLLGQVGDEVAKILGLGGGGNTITPEVISVDQQAWDTLAGSTSKEWAEQILGPRPTKAKGGKVSPWQDYIVGEKGWELFRPKVPGTIMPHNQSLRFLRRMMMPESRTQYIPTRSTTTTRSNSFDNRQTHNTFNVPSSQGMRMVLAQTRGFR